jgi:hypothetical protein
MIMSRVTCLTSETFTTAVNIFLISAVCDDLQHACLSCGSSVLYVYILIVLSSHVTCYEANENIHPLHLIFCCNYHC